MKNKFIQQSLLVSLLFIVVMASSCSKGFQEINKSVDFVSDPNLDFLLPSVELNMLDRTYYTQGDFAAPLVGQVTQGKTYATLIAPGGNHGYHFDWVYQNPLKSVADLIDHSKTDPVKVNYLSIGRIIRVYLFSLLTDVYGDVPYFEANQGYTNQAYFPSYDPQQKIYEDMFKELQEAGDALTPGKTVPTASSDIVYKGDITKWKKFANGMMLRLGLRIMNVDAVNGKKWIAQAITSGLPAGNQDNFIVTYMPSSYYGVTQNGQPHIFIRYFNNYRLTAPFVDSLKIKNDPRITAYCMLPGSTSAYVAGDKTASKQKGYPMFGSIAETKSNFSVGNINTFGRYEAPYIHLSYAQTQFQLSECVVRGIITGDAKAYYENGVRAAMDELKIFGAEGVITTAQAAAYLLQNPYNPVTNDDALQLINTQYWIETHFNWYETFANMRRSGYPKIYNQFTDGTVLPRRLTYPLTEAATNPHLQDAIKRQGLDVVTSRVWWDK
ncbi:MAG TPA: SusD/RagB family nutrient-binding outer membrane lipoprotein [Chitinophagaceae bacterium]|nr:SusD/RagB family nutrient-binding outer membrane lipoprotein [Chitinophagaceae bacterium]